jgi:signal transduction histidine kinase
VDVALSPDRRTLTVRCVNAAPRRSADAVETAGTGHGLVGMRERVRLLDGVLDTGPTDDGGFAVRARLPLPAIPPEEVPRP